MGNINFKIALLKISAVFIILLAGISGSMVVSAEESDFIIEDGVLKQYLGTEKEITIPSGVLSIGADAFLNSSIESVIIPEGVNKIEAGAFKNCKKLTEIVIPDGVDYIGESAFLNCTGLEMVNLPESIRIIEQSCFMNCTSLGTIYFPTQEFHIGAMAFENTLWMVNYEGDYAVINNTLVQYRGKETDITIPDNIEVIGAAAFFNCSFIANINFPEGVKEIDYSAFSGCSGLTEIILPDSIAAIEVNAFDNCSNLADITVPKDAIIRENPFNNTKWMEDYQGDFIILNGNLLVYRGNEKSVVIPDNVTTICGRAFTDNSLYEVILPNNLIKLCYMGFDNCRNLEKVYISGKNTYIEYPAFYNCSSDLTLYSASGGTAEEYANSHCIPFVNYGLNKEKATIYVGKNNNVSLSVNGITGEVRWESEDKTIAKVSQDGIVTAVKAGTTKIKAIVNGITMSCQITVKDTSISKKTLTIMAGCTSRLNIIGVSSGIKWSSSNKSVATVNNNGVVTAIKAGTTVITAKYNGNTYTCTVTVR